MCSDGYYYNGSTCVKYLTSTSTSCPTGYYYNGTTCVQTTSCPEGYVYSNG